MQKLPHAAIPVGHWHTPPAQETRAGHACPHAPQFEALDAVSVHPAAQGLSPAVLQVRGSVDADVGARG
ncbi:MAG: hypothetical protein WCJ30_09535, partial [Deltaproteobacteria bacterium]